VTRLEEQMQELRELPARVAGVELQIVQLRHEMQEAFSATRSEFGGKVDGLHGRMDGLRDELRTEMHGIRDELRTETHGIRDELLAEIRLGDQATRDFMRMLFEHHQSNLRTIGEGTPRKGRKR
jgi:hypothetical protein